MLHEFKLDKIPPKFLSISTEHGEKDPNMIGQYEVSSKNSAVKMIALKMKKEEDKHLILTTNNFKQSRHLQSIGKLIKLDK